MNKTQTTTDTPNLLTREEVEALMAIRPCDDVPMLSPREFNCLCKMALRYLDGQWQDISTAPRDGTEILVARKSRIEPHEEIVRIDYWSKELGDVWAKSPRDYQPTHYMPLPSPPKEKP